MPLLLAGALSSCIATKAVSLAASGLYNGAKLAGKTVYYAGKGLYKIGELSVHVADGVLDGTERTLRLTILTMDAAGSIARTSRIIPASALDAELAILADTDGVFEVYVEKSTTPKSEFG